MKKISFLLLVVLLFNTLLGIDCLAYNPTDAQTYAYTYWQNYNSSFPDFSNDGGDCANFVSQCLNAGGFTTTDEGKTYKRLLFFKTATPAWCNAYELGEYIKNTNSKFHATVVYYPTISSLSTYDSSFYIGDPIRYLFGYKSDPSYHMAIVTQSCWLYGTEITQHTTDRQDCSYKYTGILSSSEQLLTSCTVYHL